MNVLDKVAKLWGLEIQTTDSNNRNIHTDGTTFWEYEDKIIVSKIGSDDNDIVKAADFYEAAKLYSGVGK
ncbi:hypothetical protein AB4262_04435 [Vibrio breoganii]|uniref:hypothetical protein n=1 Tax=Vibrio TaxID=662 RepID=UPI000C865EE9|nr:MULTISPECIES: hypothetical protein [Vibrio]KAB0463170.1 hypothetical protein F7Q89_14825 [Vibrio kanaloae]PMG83562.1 hypothetical protein BCU81_14960 [Vibrio breoganii]PML41723.1 hypothetical protein BCT78_17470 [Vibrio breoganii]